MSAIVLALAGAWPPAPALAQATPEAAAPRQAPVIDLNEALRRAAAADPARPGDVARARAAEAGVRQAGARLNPALGLTVENLPTFGGGDLMDRAETTLSYEQQLERGGDRQARTSVARGEGELVRAQARVAQLNRLEAVQVAWVEALGAEASLEVAREKLSQARSFRSEVRRRVDAARDPLFAGARADAELAQAQIEYDQAQVAVRVAQISLARYWDGQIDFAVDRAALEDVSAARIGAGDVAQADLDVFAAQRAIAEAQVKVETARAVPDPTVSVGVRHIWDNEVALVFGGSMPLQRYDRNQGAIDRARAESVAAEAGLAAKRLELEREIARLQVQLSAKASEARRMGEEILPQAARAVDLARDGFRRGGFSYNDIVSTQNALLQARARRVAVLQEFHVALARLDRLTGAHAALLGAEIAQ